MKKDMKTCEVKFEMEDNFTCEESCDLKIDSKCSMVDLDTVGFQGKGSDILSISQKIIKLKNYFKKNKKDSRVARTIVVLVQRRKKLLNYLEGKDKSFHSLIIQRIAENIED